MFAILFDLDGTLTDSNPIHFLAWQKLLEVEKFVIDREFYEKNISGRGNIFRDCTVHMSIGRISMDIIPMLLPNLSEDERMQIAEKKDLLFCQFVQERLQPTKGLKKIIEYIQQNRSKLKIGKQNASLISIFIC
jgi:beta-phosphoglucomutase